MKKSGRWSPLGLAIHHEDEGVVGMLIARGAGLETRFQDDIETKFLMDALQNCNLDARRMLLSLLGFAIIEHDLEVVRILLENDHTSTEADYFPSAFDDRESGSGWTPLGYAIEKRNAGIVHLLLTAKASVDAICKGGWACLSPLVYASEKGDEEIVRLLIQNGAEAEMVSHGVLAGWTPLGGACKHGHEGIARLLLRALALPDTSFTIGDTQYTPMGRAIEEGHESIVSLLLENSGSVDTFCREAAGRSWTPLSYAADVIMPLAYGIKGTEEASKC